MSQHDMIIDNANGATARADINDALQALASTSKGTTRPSTVYAGQLWLDDNTPSATEWTLYLYDGTDDIALGTFDTTANTSTPFVAGASILAGPTFTSTPSAPTAADNTNSTVLATTAFHWANLTPAFRNGLDNSDMQVAQRGTSFSSITDTITRTLDRWFAYAGAASSMSVSQQSGVGATGLNYAIRVQRPNGNSNTSNHRIAQIIESRDCYRFQGKTCTLSYYARAGADLSSTSDQIVVSVLTGTGTDEGAANLDAFTGAATPLNTTQSITTSWVRYSHTVTIASGATEIGVKFLFTPTGTAGAADYFEVTGVQLEAGPLTPYQFVPFPVSLSKCKRYLEVFDSDTTTDYISFGQCASTTVAYVIYPFKVPMRIAPTGLTVSNVGHFAVGNSGAAPQTCTALALQGNATKDSALLQATVASGLGAGNATLFQAISASGQLIFTGAEL